MTAVWMRVRAELRSRFLSIVALGLIVGVMGGVVIFAAAGARRTQSAYPRFVQAQHGMDLVLNPNGKGRDEAFREVPRLPQVEDSSFVNIVFESVRTTDGRKLDFPNVFPMASPDGRFGTTVNAIKILDGRMADPARPREAVVGFALARQLHVEPGDTLQLGLFGREGPFGQPLPPPDQRPPPLTLTIVGIESAPAEFEPLAGGYLPAIHLTPAFFREYPDRFHGGDAALVIRLRHGQADIPAFRRELRKLHERLGVRFDVPINGARQTEGVQRATQVQAVALWALALLVGVATLAVFAQSLARQTYLESTEYPTLRAVGLTPGQLFGVGLLRVAMIGLVGAAVAVGVGIALSPLAPLGVARVAEPKPGIAVDALVMVCGGVGLAVLVVAVGAIPCWWAARASRSAPGILPPPRSRPSVVAASLARLGRRPAVAAGVRMALEPGRGRTAVPVRTTVLGTTLGLFALTAALSFGASLVHLESTPRLSGWNWDVLIGLEEDFSPTPPGGERHLQSILSHDPRVAEFGLGNLRNLEVGGTRVLGLAMAPAKGSVTPSLAEGRLPAAVDEVALGSETMRSAGVGIGDTVPVGIKGVTSEMRVVGRVAMPDFFLSFTGPGDGAVVSLDWVRANDPQVAADNGYFVRFARPADQHPFLAELRPVFRNLFVFPRAGFGTIQDLKEVARVPLVLAGVVALLAMATLAHTLVTSVRRRERDLAVLKTIGFRRRQVSAAVAWQASTLAGVALVIGIPLGIVAGRWGWNLLAERLGVVPEPVVPLVAVLLVVPATILVANLVAAIPGLLAARTRPAQVLRSE